MPHIHTAAFRANPYIEIPDRFEQIRYGQIRISALEFLMPLKLEDEFQVLGFHPVIQKTIVADFLKSAGKHMHQETPDEFLIFQRDFPSGFAGGLPSGGKSGFRVCDRKDPAV